MPKSQTIKPGLIIYRSARHSTFSRNNAKYRRFPSRVVHYLRDFRNIRSTLSMKPHYISKIAHSHIPDIIFDHNFLKLLTRTRNIKKLILEFSAIPYRELLDSNRWRNKKEELRIKKIIRKIFVLCSKVQKFCLKISDSSFGVPQRTVPFPFKCLLFAKCLKHFNCNFDTTFFPHFRYLVNYFVCANRRGLKHTSSLKFTAECSYLDFQHSGLDHLREIIQKINDLSKNSSFKFDLYFDEEYEEEEFQKILRFSQIFSKLQNTLGLIIRPDQDGDRLLQLLEKISDSAHLTKLDLILKSSKESGDESPLHRLSHFLVKAKSLTSLQITLTGFVKNNSVNSFIEQLRECSELSSLTLRFEDCQCADDSLLISLTKSLEHLPKFTNLALSCQARSPSSSALQYTNSGMKSFFKNISALENLEEFDLSFQESSQFVINQKFLTLCKSLKNLKLLRKFTLKDTKESLIFQLNK